VTAPPSQSPEQVRLQPWLHDLSISVKGNVTALSARTGDMGAAGVGAGVGATWSAAGAQGVYVDDRRAVSVLAVQLGDQSPVLVAEASSGGRSDFFCAARRSVCDGPDSPETGANGRLGGDGRF